MVLVGLAAEEPVEPLEPPTEWPTLPRSAGHHRARGREMPLAHRERRVAVAHEDLGHHPVRLRHRRVVAGEARRELDDSSHPAAVVVAAREQARTRRRAQRGGVEVGVAEPVRSQPVERRRRDGRAVATELRVSDVVEQHDDDVGRALGRGRKVRPPRRRVFERATGDPLKLSGLHLLCRGYASALAFSWPNSSSLMTPASSKAFAFSICSAGPPPGAFTPRM